MPKAGEETQKYSDEVLEAIAPKAAKFLDAIGAHSIIRTLMAQVGMTKEDINEGSKLMVACWDERPDGEVELDTEAARAQRAAVATLDQWDGPNFLRFGATLERHHPSAGAYVFYKLVASTGAESVAGVATFLQRIDTLENGTDPQRAATKKDDKKAVELLAKRGLDKAERARLAALVETALQATTPLSKLPPSKEDQTASRKQALIALKQWYDEWTANARSVIKKRSYLIRMGLANRKSRTEDPEPIGDSDDNSEPSPK